VVLKAHLLSNQAWTNFRGEVKTALPNGKMLPQGRIRRSDQFRSGCYSLLLA